MIAKTDFRQFFFR